VILKYEYTAVGSSHISKGAPNQDAIKAELAGNGWVVAAVADGVGSCKYSDDASALAVDISVRVCLDEINASGGNCDLLQTIEKAFAQAELEIDKLSLSRGHYITDYDTTLSLVVYDGKNITYGHSGDGGIIGLNNAGEYIKITTPQKKEGIYVIPLRQGKDSWVIGRAEGEFASVLLATDGVYDIFFPYLLRGQPADVYVRLIRYFMDNNVMQLSEENVDAIYKERADYLDSSACASITDDKTVLVLVNGNIMPAIRDDGYYAEPDWAALQLEWEKKAYPHLFSGKDAAGTSGANEEIKEPACATGTEATSEAPLESEAPPAVEESPATGDSATAPTTAPISTGETGAAASICTPVTAEASHVPTSEPIGEDTKPSKGFFSKIFGKV